MKEQIRGKRLISMLLCFVMLLSLVSMTAFAAEPGTRTKVSSVTATSNISDVLKYNGANERPTFNFTDGIVRFSPSMGGWQKQNGSDWDKYEGTTFTEGTYRYKAQMRIDSDTGYGTTHVLDTEGVTIAVNGVNWTVGSVMVYDTYSYVWVDSPEYDVVEIAGLPLTFTKNDNWNIDTNYIYRAITSFSVIDGVTGGTKPYTFSKVSGPNWLNVSNTGTVSGTPIAVGTNDNLVIRVTDNKNNTKEITLSVADTAINPADRTKVSNVTATSNMGDVLKYNGANERPTFNFTDGIVRFSPSMGGWQKKNGSSWDEYEETTFTEGTYNYRAQMRIDSTTGYGTTHVLDTEGVTLAVNGVNWTVESVRVYDTYSWVWVVSPEYTVSSSGAHAHIHSWASTWTTNGTHHWHECIASGCDITDNSQKSGYAAHSGSIANCCNKAVCSTCNVEYGEKNPVIHANSNVTTKYDDDYHWNERNCCGELIISTKQAHTYDNDTDTTCDTCGYERSLAPATYTVTFNNNGHGTAPATQTVESGNKATEPTALVEEGWTFGGWYEDATFMVAYDFDTSVTSNITLYAKWTEDSVTPPTIAIVEGNGSEWTKGTNADLTFKSNADFANFTRVEVDGAEVDVANYTAESGSTIVTLKASFLETLSVGEHTIVIVSANDTPEAKFTVKPAATGGNTGNNGGNNGGNTNTGNDTGNEKNPNTGAISPLTGDSGNMFMWIALLFVSLGGITTTAVVYKKRKTIKE